MEDKDDSSRVSVEWFRLVILVPLPEFKILAKDLNIKFHWHMPAYGPVVLKIEVVSAPNLLI